MEFANKVVLVTGASAGIGAATAIHFAKLSANVALVGRNQAKLNKVAQTCKKYNEKVLPIIADVSIEKDVERIIHETISTFGKLDVLVNNAGFSKPSGVLDGLEPYDSVMATNVRGVYHLTGLAAPHLTKTKGNIVNISSVGSQIAGVNVLAYHMSKAALDMFTKCVALELAPHGIRVNSVNPGPVRTDFLTAYGLSQQQSDEFFDNFPKGIPLKRASDAEEIADMIVYLAGDKARGMTGSIVFIDNGFLLDRPKLNLSTQQ